MFGVEVTLPRIFVGSAMSIDGGLEYTSTVERRTSLPQASSD